MSNQNAWDRQTAEQRIREALTDPEAIPPKTMEFVTLVERACDSRAEARSIAYALAAGGAKPESQWLEHVGTCLSHMAGPNPRAEQLACRHYELLRLDERELSRARAMLPDLAPFTEYLNPSGKNPVAEDDQVYRYTKVILQREWEALCRTVAAAIASVQLMDDPTPAREPEALARHYANWYEGIAEAAKICGATMHMAESWSVRSDRTRWADQLAEMERRGRDLNEKPQTPGEPVSEHEVARRMIEIAAAGVAAGIRRGESTEENGGSEPGTGANARLARYWLECVANLPG